MRITYNDVDYDDYAHVNVYVKHDGEPVEGALVSGEAVSGIGNRTRVKEFTDERGIARFRLSRNVARLQIYSVHHDELTSEEVGRIIDLRPQEEDEIDDAETEDSSSDDAVIPIAEIPVDDEDDEDDSN